MANMKQLLKNLLIALFLGLSNISCWEDKSFYLEDLGIYLDIEEKAYYDFRVFIYKNLTDRGKDYIDLHYDMSEMPSIRLCFPNDSTDKVYLIDIRHDVVKFESSNFEFIKLSPEPVRNGELVSLEKLDRIDMVFAQIDSVCDSISSICVQLNSGLVNLSEWSDGNYGNRVIIQKNNK